MSETNRVPTAILENPRVSPWTLQRARTANPLQPDPCGLIERSQPLLLGPGTGFSCCLLSVPAWSGVWKALRWWSCLDGVRLLRCVVGMSACSCLSQAVGRSAVVDRAWAWGYSPALTKQTAVFGGWCLPVLMADARLCARRPAALLHSLFLRPCLDLFPEMVVSLLFLGLVDLGYLEVALPAWFSSSFLPSLLSVAFLFSVAGCSQ